MLTFFSLEDTPSVGGIERKLRPESWCPPKKKRLTLVLQPLSVHPGLCPVTHSSFVLKRPVFNHRNIKPVKRWFKTFMETGSILDRKKSGRPSIDEEATDAVRVTFHRSPRKSIRVASNELAIPGSTVHKV